MISSSVTSNEAIMHRRRDHPHMRTTSKLPVKGSPSTAASARASASRQGRYDTGHNHTMPAGVMVRYGLPIPVMRVFFTGRSRACVPSTGSLNHWTGREATSTIILPSFTRAQAARLKLRMRPCAPVVSVWLSGAGVCDRPIQIRYPERADLPACWAPGAIAEAADSARRARVAFSARSRGSPRLRACGRKGKRGRVFYECSAGGARSNPARRWWRAGAPGNVAVPGRARVRVVGQGA
jgi:hypothetical protein